MKIKITERGWPGHFCACFDCTFRRNTLIEKGKRRIVVSTVGNYRPNGHGHEAAQTIGCSRYYETMAFEAIKQGNYWEANIDRDVPFTSPWAINKVNCNTDILANDMHEAVVKELCGK